MSHASYVNGRQADDSQTYLLVVQAGVARGHAGRVDVAWLLRSLCGAFAWRERMNYQIAFFDRGMECWRYHRKDFEIVHFASLEEAEQEAVELSKTRPEQEILVMTIHVCFKTDTEYPKVEPIQRTRRFFVMPKGSVETEDRP